MPKKTQDKKVNAFRVRIYDNDVLTSVYELWETKQFDSMNDLLGRAVAIGIEEIYAEFGKRKALSSPVTPDVPDERKIDELLKRQRDMELMQTDTYVMMSVIETMTTTLYNVVAAKVNGEAVSAEQMDSGFFSLLPERYQYIKDQLIRRIEQKKKRI